MSVSKEKKLIRKLESHLRLTARQLLKFDTEEEVLQYLVDSFQSRFECDFVGVILREGDYIVPKAWSGGLLSLKRSFPLRVDRCAPEIFQQSTTNDDHSVDSTCEFTQLVRNEIVKTWFTVPIQDEQSTYGFCTIGYLKVIPLLEMEEIFNEFGKDVAIAPSLTKRKEYEQMKMMGIEFISKNLSLNESIENIVEKIVGHAGRSTKATFAGIYLYDEEHNYFQFQPPSFGKLWKPEKILVQENYVLKEYFPFLEKPGGNELTVPLMMDVKTFGVLHLEKSERGVFTEEDLEMLTIMAEHVSTLLRNAYLYKNEREQMKRLHSLLDYQQILIKKTIEDDDFDGITAIVNEMFNQPVLLVDRFFRVLSNRSFPIQNIQENVDELKSVIQSQGNQLDYYNVELFIDDIYQPFSIWKINSGRDLMGYVVIGKANDNLDAFDQLAVDLVRNTYSVQFIKQKLVLDTKAKIEDNFMEKLLDEEIQEIDKILQYANHFQWDVFQSHRVAVLSVIFDENSYDFFEQQEKMTSIYEELKIKITNYYSNILFSRKGDVFILIVPVEKEEPDEQEFWKDITENIQRWLHHIFGSCYGLIGIGGKTNGIDDYFQCYKQALQTLNVLSSDRSMKRYAFFEDLGSYTLLHLIKDTTEAHYFMKNYLEKLLKYSEENNINLFQTLRVYLEQNGSIKKTADKLFIHRSTLLYRLDKIKEILELDLEDSDMRFNLMMTYKLYDLKKGKSSLIGS